MRQLSLRSPKGADTEGAGGISKRPDRAAHPWTVVHKQDRLGARAQIRLVASFFSAQLRGNLVRSGGKRSAACDERDDRLGSDPSRHPPFVVGRDHAIFARNLIPRRFTFQAACVAFSPKTHPSGAFWVTAMTSASSAVASWQGLAPSAARPFFECARRRQERGRRISTANIDSYPSFDSWTMTDAPMGGSPQKPWTSTIVGLGGPLPPPSAPNCSPRRAERLRPDPCDLDLLRGSSSTIFAASAPRN